MNSLIELIKAVRNIRNEANAPMSKPVDILVKVDNDHLAQMLNDNRDYIERFCHPENLTIGKDVEAPKLAMSGILTGAEVYIPMAELVDLDEERDRIEKEIAKLEKEVERSQKKLGNEKFVNNAPEKVVEAERQKATEWQQKLAAAEITQITRLQREQSSLKWMTGQERCKISLLPLGAMAQVLTAEKSELCRLKTSRVRFIFLLRFSYTAWADPNSR